MTSAEFKIITEPYLTRKPNKDGEPSSMVLWHQFAEDLQKLAEEGQPADSFLARLAEVERRDRMTAMLMNEYGVTEQELRQAFDYFKSRVEMYSKRGLTDGFRRIDSDHKGSLSAAEITHFFTTQAYKPACLNERTIAVLVDWADMNGDDNIDYAELSAVLLCDDILAFAELVPDKKQVSAAKKASERPIGAHGCKAAEVQAAQALMVERMLQRAKNRQAVLTYLDRDGSGELTRDEIKEVCKAFHLLTYKEPGKNGRVIKGDLSVAAIETILDIVDLIAQQKGLRKTAEQGVPLMAFAHVFDCETRGGELIDILQTAGL